MSRRSVTINNNSISSTATSDYKKAISEYIWNGFDANAHIVSIDYEKDEFDNIKSLSITDDGEGINRSKLGETFGCYQDSIKKKSFQWSSQIKGKKGKGRYSFTCFAKKAKWTSVYSSSKGNIEHSVSLTSGDLHHYNDEDNDTRLVYEQKTGTTVSFYDITLAYEALQREDFIDYLKKEFAVFLELNKSFDKRIIINGEVLDYKTIISESEESEVQLANEDGSSFTFRLTFIRWEEKTKENYCIYFLNEEMIEKYEQTTSLNKKDTDFHHSLYVQSSYFNSFIYEEKPNSPKDAFGYVNQTDEIFKKLLKKAKEILIAQQHKFIKDVGGPNLIKRYEEKGIIRHSKNEYDNILIEDLKETVKQIYGVEPKIFINLHDNQAKTIVGLLELLLQTDKRDNILLIIENIVKLTDEERSSLAGILQKTELSNIIQTIEMLEDRVKVVSALKSAIFNPIYGVDEVHDLQKMIEKSFWLFGEQYNIVTEAEPDFQQALDKYIEMLQKEKGISKSFANKEKLEHPDKNKEMDIFAFRQNMQNDIIENIVVELKHPKVKLGEVEVSQVKTYMNVITNAETFNSANMTWKFFLIGNDFDSSNYILNELDSQKSWGIKNLIHRVDRDGIKYEIFVYKWSDIFASFEIRHKFLMDKLQLKRDLLTSSNAKDKEELHNIIDEASAKC